MNTEVCRRRKQPIENYLHTVLQITVVLDITDECFGTGSGETVHGTVQVLVVHARNAPDNPMPSALRIVSRCVPSPFHP